jgi:hypothetical protein
MPTDPVPIERDLAEPVLTYVAGQFLIEACMLAIGRLRHHHLVEALPLAAKGVLVDQLAGRPARSSIRTRWKPLMPSGGSLMPNCSRSVRR